MLILILSQYQMKLERLCVVQLRSSLVCSSFSDCNPNRSRTSFVACEMCCVREGPLPRRGRWPLCPVCPSPSVPVPSRLTRLSRQPHSTAILSSIQQLSCDSLYPESQDKRPQVLNTSTILI